MNFDNEDRAHWPAETNHLTDPVFFLHHAQVDRLWYLWQQENPDARNTQFGGPKTRSPETPEATIHDVLPYLGLTSNVIVSEVMTTQNSRLCYTY